MRRTTASIRTFWSLLHQRACVAARQASCAERGASLVEYALLVALIALVCFVAVTTLGATTAEQFNEIGASLGN